MNQVQSWMRPAMAKMRDRAQSMRRSVTSTACPRKHHDRVVGGMFNGSHRRHARELSRIVAMERPHQTPGGPMCWPRAQMLMAEAGHARWLRARADISEEHKRLVLVDPDCCKFGRVHGLARSALRA